MLSKTESLDCAAVLKLTCSGTNFAVCSLGTFAFTCSERKAVKSLLLTPSGKGLPNLDGQCFSIAKQNSSYNV